MLIVCNNRVQRMFVLILDPYVVLIVILNKTIIFLMHLLFIAAV